MHWLSGYSEARTPTSTPTQYQFEGSQAPFLLAAEELSTGPETGLELHLNSESGESNSVYFTAKGPGMLTTGASLAIGHDLQTQPGVSFTLSVEQGEGYEEGFTTHSWKPSNHNTWYASSPLQYQSSPDFQKEHIMNQSLSLSLNENGPIDWHTHLPSRDLSLPTRDAAPPDRLETYSMTDVESASGWGRVAADLRQHGVRPRPEDKESKIQDGASVRSIESTESTANQRITLLQPETETHPEISTLAPNRQQFASRRVERRRQTLTKEQRRCNHIRYEKRRRARIDDGFNSLVDIVPGLKGRNWPRVRILRETFNRLEHLFTENEKLRSQIAAR